jgi:hypothetical protein
MLKRLLLLFLALGVSFSLGFRLSSTPTLVNATGQDTCPEGGDWDKKDGINKLSYSYTAPSGKVVIESCYKAGTTLKTATYSPGVASVTLSSTVWNKTSCPGDNGCNYQNISHASFKLAIASPTPTPTASPTPTPTPPVCPESYSCSECAGYDWTDKSSCSKEMKSYCRRTYDCGWDENESWYCPCPTSSPSPSPSPTPTPEITPVPSPTPQATPTPEPSPESKTKRDFWSTTNCDGQVALRFTFLENDGSGADQKTVKFFYNNEVKETKTDSNGKAGANFRFAGEKEAKIEFDGQSKTTNVKAAENCDTPQVLGATTGTVLGASTLAATGFSADAVMNLIGFSGMALTALGYRKYGKKN